MSIIDTLITDRTAADVQRAEYLTGKAYADMTEAERAEWDAGLRGAYNATDLNRVTAAMEYLAGRFEGYGYIVDYVPVVIERPEGSGLDPRLWYGSDIPTPEQMQQYLDNVESVRRVMDARGTVPGDMDDLTAAEANEIEIILKNVETILQRVVRAFRRSAAFAFWSGNAPFPSADSNFGRTWAELDAMRTTWKNWQVATWYLLLYGNLKAEGAVE